MLQTYKTFLLGALESSTLASSIFSALTCSVGLFLSFFLQQASLVKYHKDVPGRK